MNMNRTAYATLFTIARFIAVETPLLSNHRQRHAMQSLGRARVRSSAMRRPRRRSAAGGSPARQPERP